MKSFREFVVEVNRPENGSPEEKKRWDVVKKRHDAMSPEEKASRIIGTLGRDGQGIQRYGFKKKSSRTDQQTNRASRLKDVDSDLDSNLKTRGDQKKDAIVGRGKEHHHLTSISQSSKEFWGMSPEERREKREKDAKAGKFHGSDPRNLAQTDGPKGGTGIPHRGEGGYHSRQKAVGKGGSIQDYGSESEILAIRRKIQKQGSALARLRAEKGIKTEGNKMKNYKNFLEESISFRSHDKLNPTFWNGEKLKPEVRSHLLKVAKSWADFVDIKKSNVKDILLLGGNAGYNYTKYSDLDLHIVADTKSCPDVMSDYYQAKKQLWTLTHNVKVYGHDVEPYVEEPGKDRRKSQGVFSLKSNKWLIKPEKFSGDLDKDLLNQKVNDMIGKINRTIQSSNNEEVLEKLLKKIRDMRNSGLDKAGEYAFENLVFKELRNKGYIDKLATYILKLQDKSLTLENYVS
jgi:hypothetical protein